MTEGTGSATQLLSMIGTQQIHVRRALALAAAFSFLCSGARFCLLPFLTLYLRGWGLSPAMTGGVLGTKHLVTLVWGPAAALLSRRYDQRRALICGSLLCSAAAALVLLLIPAVVQTPTCNTSDPGAGPSLSLTNGTRPTAPAAGEQSTPPGLTGPAETRPGTQPAPAPNRTRRNQPNRPHLHESEAQMTTTNISVAAGPNISSAVDPVSPVRPQRSQVKSVLPGEEQEVDVEDLGSLRTVDPQNQLFFVVLIVVFVWELASAPLDWTVDDGLYEYLDFADAADRHQGARLWALLGAACGAGGVGLLVSQLTCLLAGGAHRSTVHFYAYAAVTALALPVAAYLPLYLTRKRDRAAGLLRAVRLVRGSPRALLCAVTILLAGAASSAVDDFLLWQMQDHGSDELHMGLSLVVALLSQASFPLLAGRLSRLLSPARILVLGAAGLGLQCFYFSFLWGPWAALPAQLLGFLSGGALWWAVDVHCEDVASPGAERSVSRVYAGLCLPLGRCLGSVAGGVLVQTLGLPWLFGAAAAVLMLWCVVLPLLQCKAPHQRGINYSRLLAADASEASDSGSEQDRDWLDKAMEDNRSNNNQSGRRINHWTD